MDLSRVVAAIVVGVITGLVIYFIGVLLVEFNLESVGRFFERFAPLLGFLAGLWYFVTGQRAL